MRRLLSWASAAALLASAPAALAAGSSLPPGVSAHVEKDGAATVRCESACVIVLEARRGPRSARATHTLREAGTVTLRLSARELARLGPGQISFSVQVSRTSFTKHPAGAAGLR